MMKFRSKAAFVLSGVLVSTLTALSPAYATEGTKDGGGGGAFLCAFNTTPIITLMADLWEAEFTPFRWPHKTGTLRFAYDNATSAEEQFAKALAKLASVDPQFADVVRKEKEQLFANKRALPSNIAITVPDDLKIGYFPKGCELVGIMYYNGESEQLDVREDFFSILRTKTDIAAAWMHEAVYKVLRDRYSHQTSKLARRLVGCLFSEETNCLLAEPIVVPTDRLVYQCSSQSYEITVFPKERLTDPKELISEGSYHEFHALVDKVADIGLKYSPNYEFIVIGGPVSLSSFYSRKGGMSAYGVVPRLELIRLALSKAGDIESLYINGHSHLERMKYTHEDLTCRRLH